ncbi:MAG TPA: hypothetical protein VI386_25895 [Candidatus Sulfotelmatobacter sp.]
MLQVPSSSLAAHQFPAKDSIPIPLVEEKWEKRLEEREPVEDSAVNLGEESYAEMRAREVQQETERCRADAY